MAALEPPANPEDQRRFLAAMQSFRRALSGESPKEGAPPNLLSPALSAKPELGKELLRYLRPTPGSDLFLGRGLVLERIESPDNPLRAPGAPNTPPGGTAAPALYRIDLGGAVLEAYSAERRQPGDFASFHLEREGGRLWIRFRDAERSLPPELRQAYAAADRPGKAALLLAADHLGSDLEKPGFVAAARDFA